MLSAKHPLARGLIQGHSMNTAPIIITREIGIGDIQACVDIYLSNKFEDVSYENELQDQIMQSLDPETPRTGVIMYKFLVAEYDGKVVGFACYSQLPFDAAGYGLSWCYVSPPYQGSGVGKLLVSARIEAARKAGAEFILSSQREEHKWHLERFGFKKIGTGGSYKNERFALMHLVLSNLP